jgi:hypothetical protein
VAKIPAATMWVAAPALCQSSRVTPEFSIQSRPDRARHACQIRRVQRWSRYSGTLTPQNTAMVAAPNAASRFRSGADRVSCP